MFGIYLTPDWPCLDNYRCQKSKSPIFEFLKNINFDSQLHMKPTSICARVMHIMIANSVYQSCRFRPGPARPGPDFFGPGRAGP